MPYVAFDERLMRRAGGAGFVVLLHIIAISALLRATLTAVHVAEPGREGIVWFILPHRPKNEPIRVIPAPGEQSRPARIYTYRGISIPAQRTRNAIAPGLRTMLFDCAPENLGNLTIAQRSLCASRILAPDDSEVYADHTNRSHDAALWARGRARKDQPLLLPCASPYSAGISLGTVICLAHGLINGFDLDNQPGYGDVPQPVSVPNGGDPPTHPPG